MARAQAYPGWAVAVAMALGWMARVVAATGAAATVVVEWGAVAREEVVTAPAY